METVPIGSISFFVNTTYNENLTNNDVADIIAQSIIDYINKKLVNELEEVIITGYKIRRGCLIIEIFFSVATAKIVLSGAYSFIKDYPDIKKGLNVISKDLQCCSVWLKKVSSNGIIKVSAIVTKVIKTKATDVENLSITEPNTKLKTSDHKLAVIREDLDNTSQFINKSLDISELDT